MATIDRRGVSVDATDTAIAGAPNPGLAIKAPVAVATTTNTALTGLQTIDGVALLAGMRVLVWQQTDAKANGIYNASSGPWTRSIDMSSNDEIAGGVQVKATTGTLFARSIFEVTSLDPITIGTSNIVFDVQSVPRNSSGAADFTINTFDDLPITAIPADVAVLRTLGRSDVGDNGHARYYRIGPAAATAWSRQSLDGQNWSLLDRDVTPEVFNAIEHADCTAGYQALAAWINLVGGGLGGCRIFNKPGAVYDIFPQSGGSPLVNLMTIQGVTGLEWHFSGSRFETDNLFATTGPSLFILQNCKNFTFFGPEYREAAWTALRDNRGLAFFNITDAAPNWSKNITIFNMKQYGGFGGVICATTSLAGGYASNINVFGATLDNVNYGLQFGGNGDNVKAFGIKGSNNGRIFVAYNVTNVEADLIGNGGVVDQIVVNCLPHPTMSDDKRQTNNITIRYRNVAPSAAPGGNLCYIIMQQVVAQVTVSAVADNGSGKARLTVNSTAAMATAQKWFWNGLGGFTAANMTTQAITVINATTVDLPNVNYAPGYTSGGYARVPGTITDLALHFSCVNNEAVASSTLLRTRKNAFGASFDTVPSGYKVANVKISGSVDGYSRAEPLIHLFDTATGDWTGEDIHNIFVENLSVKGTSCSLEFNCAPVRNMVFRNIYGSVGTTWTFTGAGANTLFINIDTPSLKTAYQVGSIDFYPLLKSKMQVGNPTGDSALVVGQGPNNFAAMYWSYDAVAANAAFQISTSSYANQILINGSQVNINSASGANTFVYAGGLAPTGTLRYVRENTPTIVTPVINGLPTGTGVATANTASTLVARDASGNFSAGTITATTFSGTATNTVNSGITDDTTTNAIMFPTWVTTASGNRPLRVTSTKFVLNPSTGNVGIGNASALYLLHVGPGTDTSGLNPTFYVSQNGTTSFVVRDSTNDIELGMFTNTAGGGLCAMGTRTDHPFWIQKNSINVAAFHSNALSVGSTVDPGAGNISATTGIVAPIRRGATGGRTAVNGLNSNLAIPANSSVRITGPTGAFSVGGFTGGLDGYVLEIFNTTAQAMTIVNEDALSTAGNRITTCTGADVVLPARTSCARFVYDLTSARWILRSYN